LWDGCERNLDFENLWKIKCRKSVSKICVKNKMSKICAKNKISKICAKNKISKICVKNKMSEICVKNEISKTKCRKSVWKCYHHNFMVTSKVKRRRQQSSINSKGILDGASQRKHQRDKKKRNQTQLKQVQ
jgi:hypothetical protein